MVERIADKDYEEPSYTIKCELRKTRKKEPRRRIYADKKKANQACQNDDPFDLSVRFQKAVTGHKGSEKESQASKNDRNSTEVLSGEDSSSPKTKQRLHFSTP